MVQQYQDRRLSVLNQNFSFVSFLLVGSEIMAEFLIHIHNITGTINKPSVQDVAQQTKREQELQTKFREAVFRLEEARLGRWDILWYPFWCSIGTGDMSKSTLKPKLVQTKSFFVYASLVCLTKYLHAS